MTTWETSSAPIGIGLYEDHNAGIAAVQGGRVLLYCEFERLTRVKNQAGWFPDIVAQMLKRLPLDDLAVVCTPSPAKMIALLVERFSGVAESSSVVRVAKRRIIVHGQDDIHPLLHFLATLPLASVAQAVYAVLIFDAEQPRLGWVDLTKPLSWSPDLHLRPLSGDRWFNGEIFAGLYGKLFYGSEDLVHCGKLMGLASWGRTRTSHLGWMRDFALRHFDTTTPTWKGYRSVRPDKIAAETMSDLGIDPRQHDQANVLDLASAAQEVFSHELVRQVVPGMEVIRREVRESNLPNPSGLIYGGGCAMSVVTNARIREALDIPLLIPPYAHDASQFLGAAVWASLKCDSSKWRIGHGWDRLPAHTVGQVRAADIDRYGARGQRADPAVVAQRILNGQLIALIEGGAEAGPRALGKRSLLANALDPRMRDRINRDVKLREWYRPFAPSVIRDAFPRYFGRAATCTSAYMLDAFRVVPDCRSFLSSVVSPDGTSRPQVVDAAMSPWFHDLLVAFGSLTGHPIMLNTSLNAPGRPIALDLPQAMDDCLVLNVDAAVVDGMLVEREGLSRQSIRVMVGSP